MCLSLLHPGTSLNCDSRLPQNLPLNEVLDVYVWREVNHRASELDPLLAATRCIRNFPSALAFSLASFCGPDGTIPAS